MLARRFQVYVAKLQIFYVCIADSSKGPRVKRMLPVPNEKLAAVSLEEAVPQNKGDEKKMSNVVNAFCYCKSYGKSVIQKIIILIIMQLFRLLCSCLDAYNIQILYTHTDAIY